MRLELRLTFVLVMGVLAAGCGRPVAEGSTTAGEGTSAGSGGSSSGSSTSGGTGADGGAPCFPGATRPEDQLRCDPHTQFCLNDYAGVSSYPHPNSCQPLVADCANNPSCACLTQHFQCGLSTTCVENDAGIAVVVCQPD